MNANRRSGLWAAFSPTRRSTVIIWAVGSLVLLGSVAGCSRTAVSQPPEQPVAANSAEPPADAKADPKSETQQTKPKDAKAFIERGNALYAKKDYDKAIADFSEAIRLDPKLAEAYGRRAHAYQAKGDDDKAIADATTALELDSKLFDGYYSRGFAYLHKGDNDKAIADFTKAVELKPHSPRALVGRGNAYVGKGRTDLAILDYTEAIRLNPKLVVAYRKRSAAYAKQGKRALARADRETADQLDAEKVAAGGTLPEVEPAEPDKSAVGTERNSSSPRSNESAEKPDTTREPEKRSTTADPAPLGWVRTRPASKKYFLTTRREYGINEVALDLGEVAKGDNYVAKAAVVYDSFGKDAPKVVNWNTLELVVSVAGPASLTRNPITGEFYKRGIVGYGGCRFVFRINDEPSTLDAELDAKDGGKVMGEAMRASLKQGFAEQLYKAKRVALKCGSDEFAVEFSLDDEALAGFCDLIDRIALVR
jgi:tetratricopeptide (TPR) repeat protein